MKSSIDRQGDFAAVGWAQGRSHHTYEDRFRLLTSYIPLVATSGRGDLVAVFDGVGSAPQGMQAAQALADALLGFYTVARPVVGSSGQACGLSENELLEDLGARLLQASAAILCWGFIEGTQRPCGAAAGSVAWIPHGQSTAHVLHAGDTQVLRLTDAGALRVLSTMDQGPGGELLNYFGAQDLVLRHSTCAISPGDRLVLFSDGVSKGMSHQQITVLSARCADPATMCKAALEKCRQSTSDDITMVVYEVE